MPTRAGSARLLVSDPARPRLSNGVRCQIRTGLIHDAWTHTVRAFQAVDGSAASLAQWPGLDDGGRGAWNLEQGRAGGFCDGTEVAGGSRDEGLKLPSTNDKSPLGNNSAFAVRDQRHWTYWGEEEGAGAVQVDTEETEEEGLHCRTGRQRAQARMPGGTSGRTGTVEEEEGGGEEEEESSLHLPRNTEAVVAAAEARRDASILDRCLCDAKSPSCIAALSSSCICPITLLHWPASRRCFSFGVHPLFGARERERERESSRREREHDTF